MTHLPTREPAFLIDGHWTVEGAAGRFAVTNPATGAELARVPEADDAVVDRAVRAARAAFPDWRDGGPYRRAALLRRFAAIVVSSEDKAEADATARAVGRAAPQVEGMHVFGPAPAPLAMLRGRHRFRLLVHATRALDVQDIIRDWLGALDWSAKVRVAVDVDPYNFL